MTNDYIYIQAWGIKLGSDTYFIQNEIDRAMKDNAPYNAIYRSGKIWHTLDECCESSKADVNRIVKQLKNI